MGKLKSLFKAKLYPCLLALCDEQIADLSTRVTMLANPDTACRVDTQGKGGNGGGGGNSWRGKGHKGTHATSYQDGRNQSGTPPVNPEQCVFCPKSHPFLFYCEVFIKSRVKDRYQMVLKQKSCMRCLSMSTILDGRKVMA